jgi:hypothetical protein
MLALKHKKKTLRHIRRSEQANRQPILRMAKSCTETMTYYQRLNFYSDKALKQHPRSTVVMNADTFEVLATGTSMAKLAKKIKTRASGNEVAVMVGRPPVNQITMLGCR